jgi:ABC-type multidrug transport system permease subunit
LLIVNKPEGIGAWLAFKVAAKWESWTNIVKFNEKLENKDDFEYLKLRNNLATSVLQRFLIGTILNILIAFIGIVIFFIVRTSIITQELNKNLGFIKGAIFIILGICILIEIVLFFSRKRCEKCPKKIVN